MAARRTKLEAVNGMLLDIGERPVNDIATPTRLDVIRALDSLDEVGREMQSRGWWFNSELFEITPDGNGDLNVPAAMIKVDERTALDGGPFPEIANPTAGSNVQYVVRGTKLYDTTNQQSTGFTDTVRVVGVRLLDYEELPQTAREFVYAQAAVHFQSRALGSQQLDARLRLRAQSAWEELLRESMEYDDVSLALAARFNRGMFNR